MTNKDIELVEELMGNIITKEMFLEEFSVNLNEDVFLQLLEGVCEQNNAEHLECLMFIGFSFNLFTNRMASVLSQLIVQDWHNVHEDLASVLQDLKNPLSIDGLYQAAISNYDYLGFDDSCALAVKCIWALGDINTVESNEKLKLLSISENYIIKKNAIKQLQRNNVTF